jgi:hypothetical protein
MVNQKHIEMVEEKKNKMQHLKKVPMDKWYKEWERLQKMLEVWQ